MGAFLVWFLIIMFLIFYNKGKKRSADVQGRGTRIQDSGASKQEQTRIVQELRTHSVPGRPEAYEELRRKQQELKNRLQQKYPEQKQQNPVKASADLSAEYIPPQADIMSRAVANVKENAADVLEKKQVELQEDDLMAQLQDLMVMGYWVDFDFSRDFVAEGIEMLNRYELAQSEQ